MGTKTISITDDVYSELVRVKRPEESFSDEIRRLVRRKGKLSDCIGLWAKWMTKEQMNEIDENIKKRREMSRKAKEEKMRLWNERT